jgi:hypothetical protein
VILQFGNFSKFTTFCFFVKEKFNSRGNGRKSSFGIPEEFTQKITKLSIILESNKICKNTENIDSQNGIGLSF